MNTTLDLQTDQEQAILRTPIGGIWNGVNNIVSKTKEKIAQNRSPPRDRKFVSRSSVEFLAVPRGDHVTEHRIMNGFMQAHMDDQKVKDMQAVLKQMESEAIQNCISASLDINRDMVRSVVLKSMWVTLIKYYITTMSRTGGDVNNNINMLQELCKYKVPVHVLGMIQNKMTKFETYDYEYKYLASLLNMTVVTLPVYVKFGGLLNEIQHVPHWIMRYEAIGDDNGIVRVNSSGSRSSSQISFNSAPPEYTTAASLHNFAVEHHDSNDTDLFSSDTGYCSKDDETERSSSTSERHADIESSEASGASPSIPLEDQAQIYTESDDPYEISDFVERKIKLLDQYKKILKDMEHNALLNRELKRRGGFNENLLDTKVRYRSLQQSRPTIDRYILWDSILCHYLNSLVSLLTSLSTSDVCKRFLIKVIVGLCPRQMQKCIKDTIENRCRGESLKDFRGWAQQLDQAPNPIFNVMIRSTLTFPDELIKSQDQSKLLKKRSGVSDRFTKKSYVKPKQMLDMSSIVNAYEPVYDPIMELRKLSRNYVTPKYVRPIWSKNMRLPYAI